MYAVGEWVRTCCAPGPTNYFRCNLLLRCTLSAFGSLMHTRSASQFNSIISRTFRALSCDIYFYSAPPCADRRKLRRHPDGRFITSHFQLSQRFALRSTEINPGPAEISVSHALQYDDNTLNFYYCAVYVSHYCYTSIEVNWINSMTRNKYSSIDPTLRCNCTSAHRYYVCLYINWVHINCMVMYVERATRAYVWARDVRDVKYMQNRRLNRRRRDAIVTLNWFRKFINIILFTHI